MKSGKPLLKLTAYYLSLVVIVWGLFEFVPSIASHVPIGGSENLPTGVGEFVSGKATPIVYEPVAHSISFSIALLGVLLLMEPVAWVYMGARRRRGREQAFVLTILLLPVVVAGIVLIVQNSLALAFSLAGIVAGVRFRLTLDDTLDAVYIFVAIGAGLAAGTSALEIAVVVTVFFNYAVLLFWELDYADEVSVNRWFTRTWMNTGAVKEPENSNLEKTDSR
ncbi:MAG: DUF4956 domain-containing protein [bacterium]|nr:DUF4956 domain-containing protein [Gammaproteobacteria bacterium]HIL98872.1 DUF4956 domain-containing protein [Pseudomonadales bacterium]